MAKSIDLSGFDEETKKPQTASAPKKANLESFDKEPEPSGFKQDLGDLAKGLGQGVTLGGGDELLGGLQAGKEALTPGSDVHSLEDLMKSYRKHQKENEAAYDEAKKRSPYLTGAGEIAGGLALPVGVLGQATKGLGLAGKAAAMAGLGATAGALGSHGTVEGNPEEIAKDSGMGAALGLGSELGLNVAGKLAKPVLNKVSNFTQDIPSIRQTIESFNQGRQGKGFLGDKNRARLQEELEQNASGLGEDLTKMKDYGKEQYAKVLGNGPKGKSLPNAPTIKLDNNSDTLKTINNLDSALNELPGGANLENMKSTLNRLKSGEPVSANDTKELQKFIRDRQFTQEGAFKNEFGEGNDALSSMLEKQVPGYKQVNELHGQIQDPINSFIKNVPADEMNIASRPKGATIDTNTYKAAENAIQKSELPYGQGHKQSNQLRLLKEGLENLQEKDPEALKKMGINNIDDYFKNIKSQSDVQAVNNAITKSGAMNKSLIDTLSPDIGTVYKGANFVGQGAGKLSGALYSAPKEQLSQVADSLSTNPNTKFLGTALKNSLNNPGDAARNATLFSIMQNPEAREHLKGMIPGVEQEGQQ